MNYLMQNCLKDAYENWEWENNLVMKYELFHMQKGNIWSIAF